MALMAITGRGSSRANSVVVSRQANSLGRTSVVMSVQTGSSNSVSVAITVLTESTGNSKSASRAVTAPLGEKEGSEMASMATTKVSEDTGFVYMQPNNLLVFGLMVQSD